MKRSFTRVLAMGDTHCGHVAGLTPPHWQPKFEIERFERFKQLQSEAWAWFKRTVDKIKPIDVLIYNGDMIDGSGSRSGGTEQITTSRDNQVDMAEYLADYTGAKSIVMTYGTAYHTGCEEDWEGRVYKAFEDKGGYRLSIGSHEWLDVNGLIFDIKHHLGSSSIPHGRHTAIARDRLWNQLWSEREEQPKAHIYLRSHVHYHQFTGGPGWLAMTLPALQTAGTKYGARRCSGLVDYGLVHFDVNKDGTYSWQPHLAKLQHQKAQTFKV